MKNKLIVWWLLLFNRLLKKHGQNAYCLKTRVIAEICVMPEFKDCDKFKRRLRELQELVEQQQL